MCASCRTLCEILASFFLIVFFLWLLHVSQHFRDLLRDVLFVVVVVLLPGPRMVIEGGWIWASGGRDDRLAETERPRQVEFFEFLAVERCDDIVVASFDIFYQSTSSFFSLRAMDLSTRSTSLSFFLVAFRFGLNIDYCLAWIALSIADIDGVWTWYCSMSFIRVVSSCEKLMSSCRISGIRFSKSWVLIELRGLLTGT
jgi:hypothetical protein